MSDISILPSNIESRIGKFIEEKFFQDNLSMLFHNPLLREEMLDLLDKYCTVVYYPVVGEDNNGFRLEKMPFANGECRDFVFINTAQTLEKQVFTAAHELGHIWNVDTYILTECKLPDTTEIREKIINRFAAVLLMPEKEFRRSVQAYLESIDKQLPGLISINNLLRIVANLMNQFFAPMKAVVLRLVELDFLHVNVAEILFGHKNISADTFLKQIAEICIECGYTNLLNPTRKKYIEGLSQKLEIAERNRLVLPNKIQVMRDKFGLPHTLSSNLSLDEEIPLGIQEGEEP